MQVLIEIRGGMLVAVHTTDEAKVVFVDWDDYQDDPAGYEPGIFPADPMQAAHSDTIGVLQRLQ